MKKSTSKFILRTMIVVVLIFSASVYMFQYLTAYIEENRDKTIEYIKEEQFIVIWDHIENLITQANKQATAVAKEIEDDILALSESDFKQLQNDMSNGVHNETLHSILSKNTENKNLNGINNYCNGIVVLSNDGYLNDYNYRRAKNNNKEHPLVRTWENDIEASYNKELEQDAIDKITNRTAGIIALESYNLIKNENHIKIKEFTYDTLFEVYLAEGIEGIRNYQIYVPYYITDIGDIFGVPDISHGTTVDNNKIIVIQEFNIYDQLINIDKDIDEFANKQIISIIDRNNTILRLLNIFAILIATATCLLIFWSSSYYNAAFDHENDYNHHEKDIDEEIISDENYK